MELLRFTVCSQRLSGGRNRLVSDSIDYVEAVFDFRTSDWKGLSKWAHFSKGKEVYDVNLVDDKITKDMHLNLGAGIWEVKLHGTDPKGTMRITTGKAHVVVESYGRLEDGAPLPEVPLSAAEQIDAKSQKAIDIANEALGKSEISDEKIAEAVADYLEENPVAGSPGLNYEARKLLVSILRSAVYISDMSGDITALEKTLDEGGNTGETEEFTTAQNGTVLTIGGVDNISSVTQSGTVLTLV